MNRISITEIIERYKAGWGYVAANVALIAGNRLWSELKDIPVFSFTSEDSKFANMVFTNTQSGKSYAFGNEATITSNEDYTYIGTSPMLSPSRGKNKVITEIDRSEVEVIEYFGLKPYVIRIRGLLIDTVDHKYPKTLVRLINEMFTAPGTYKVESGIFSDLGITEVFLDEPFDIGFVEGYVDTVKFSMNARMTSPVELKAFGY